MASVMSFCFYVHHLILLVKHKVITDCLSSSSGGCGDWRTSGPCAERSHLQPDI